MSPRTETQSLLQVRGLTKTFSGITAVNRLDLDVEAGSIVGLIGPNGSGKSTTIDCITGFTPADGGRVLFDGSDVSQIGRAHV